MSPGRYDPIVSKQEAERDFLVYSKMQVPISHSIGKRMGMSEQWRRFRNQKTGCISEPYFFECVPLKEAGKKMRINKEAKSFGMSWEKEYGYSQAIKVDDTILCLWAGKSWRKGQYRRSSRYGGADAPSLR
jgi:hypothetical protein